MSAKKIALLLVACLMQGCFFYPRTEYPVTPDELSIQYETVRFEEHGEPSLSSWLLISKVNPPRGVILFLHGNAQNISYHLPSVAWIPERGYDVFALDYRGFGKSEGTPGVKGSLKDIERSVGYLAERYKDKPIFLFGQSIGATLGLWSLSQQGIASQIKAAVIESPFSSYGKIAGEKVKNIPFIWPLLFYPVQWFISDKYSPDNIEGPLNTPIFMLHGTNDFIVPVEHSRRLKGLLGKNSQYAEIDGAGHLGLLNDPVTQRQFIQFLDSQASKRSRGLHH